MEAEITPDDAFDGGAYTILWNEGEPAGFTDILPIEWFKDEESRSEVRHPVDGPRSTGTAMCNVNVRNNVAILDYKAFEEENEAQGMLLGVLRLYFASPSRETIRKVQWKDKENFSDCSATVGFRLPTAASLIDKSESDFAAARQRSSDDRKRRLEQAPKTPQRILVVTEQYIRNYDVIVTVLERAKGNCEDCGSPAPFRKSKDGEPYLEVHHRIFLANGGKDTVENAVALCPNCHREAHFGQR
ncbi:MAG: HNH endonuclease signature motif containing protein [Methylocella sp.]